MSALHSKADMLVVGINVCPVPIADSLGLRFSIIMELAGFAVLKFHLGS
jgi:hypothetical protein